MPRPTLARLLSQAPMGAVSFDVERPAAGWLRGAPNGAVQTFAASGVVQPAGEQQLSQLPEGDRLRETIAVYTACVLRAGGADVPADCILWQGARYRVASVRRWADSGLCQALAVRCP